MSTLITQQQPPPHPITSAAHPSLGPVIGVVAVVLILCAASIAIGRLCSGRSIMGYGHYDMERWVEAKCSSCVDGTILVFPPPTLTSSAAEGGSPAASTTEASSSTVEQQA